VTTRLPPLAAYRDGLRRVRSAPWVWAGTWAATLLLALPLALALREMIASHLGPSLAASRVAAGVDWDWWQEFSAQATGLGTTFAPTIVGGAAVLQNLSDLLDNRALATVMAGAVAAWLVLGSFLAGGILDRLARQRPVGASGFFAACGTHVWRLARLGVLAFAAYYALFAWVHGWLFDGLYPWLTRETTVERNALAVRVVLYVVFTALLVAVNLVIDYARVRLVIEDRRSAIFALTAGARFVWRHLRDTVALYLLNALGFLGLVAIYVLLAPGASWSAWLALLVGQVYIALRVAVKLGFYASQAACFQGALAHAEYVAGPAPEWPESPAVEAIRGEQAATPR
jgi:hypothetical protein